MLNDIVTEKQIETEEQRLRELRAKHAMQVLNTKGIVTLIADLQNCHTVDEAYKVVTRFSSRVNNARRVLSPKPVSKPVKK